MDRQSIIIGVIILLFCILQCLNCWLEYNMTLHDDEEQTVEVVNAIPITPGSTEEVHVKIKLKHTDIVDD